MPPIGAAIYREKLSEAGAGVCFHAICHRELGNLAQSRDDCGRKSRLCGRCLAGTWVAFSLPVIAR